MSRRIGWLVVSIMLVWVSLLGAHPASAATPAPAHPVADRTPQEAPVPWPLPIRGMQSAVTADLTAQGFESTGGYFDELDDSDCPTIVPVMGTCYAMNPAAPYVMPAVKTWDDEFVDPATELAFGTVRAGHSFIFRLDPREAIIIFAELPPPARYFGFQTYLFTRQGSIDTSNARYGFVSQYFRPVLDLFFRLSPNPDRVLQFASLSNSINNVVVQEQSGGSFSQHRVFIITPDQFMDRAVRASLESMGVPPENIFTEPIPSSMRLGLDEDADDFIQLIRYAMPEDADLAQKWRQDLPMIVLRVRDTDGSRAPEPYPADFVPETRSANSELGLMEDLDKLNNAVRARWGLRPLSRADSTWRDHFVELQRPDTLDLVGPHCTENTMHCVGDTQDTNYSYSVYLPLDHGELNAVVGTLGTETGNATYVGFGLTRKEDLVGFANVNDGQLKGTAEDYKDSIESDPDKFFVWYVGRDCGRVTGTNCSEVSESHIPRGGTLRISIRNYVVPNTRRGPNTEPSTPGGPSPILAPWSNVIPGSPLYLPLVIREWPARLMRDPRELP